MKTKLISKFQIAYILVPNLATTLYVGFGEDIAWIMEKNVIGISLNQRLFV